MTPIMESSYEPFRWSDHPNLGTFENCTYGPLPLRLPRDGLGVVTLTVPGTVHREEIAALIDRWLPRMNATLVDPLR